MKIYKKHWIVTLVILLFVFVLFWGGGYPIEVENTFTACEWCEEEGEELYRDPNINFNLCPQCFGGSTCGACVVCYKNHFNLSEEEFPTYIWSSDESPPTKLEWFFM